MAKTKRILRGLGMVSAVALAGSITAGVIMEMYPAPLDTFFNTLSSKVVSETTDEADWIYQSRYKSAKEAYEGLEDFAIREAVETFALLKNENNALPISKTAKVTLMGLRSYAPVYGNTGGSIADKGTVDRGNTIYESFAKRGFQLNPTMLTTYAEYFKDTTWGVGSYGNVSPEYEGTSVTNDVPELSPAELAAINSDYKSDFANYNDAAIVVVGRPGGENKN